MGWWRWVKLTGSRDARKCADAGNMDVVSPLKLCFSWITSLWWNRSVTIWSVQSSCKHNVKTVGAHTVKLRYRCWKWSPVFSLYDIQTSPHLRQIWLYCVCHAVSIWCGVFDIRKIGNPWGHTAMKKLLSAPDWRALRHFIAWKRVKTVHLIFLWPDITLRAGLFSRPYEVT